MLPGFPDGSYGYTQVDALLGSTPAFTVTGADGDVLEVRQTLVARDRLAPEGLGVRFHPGGHLTTHEHPDCSPTRSGSSPPATGGVP